MVSAKLCLEFVEYLSRKKTRALLKDMKARTGVGWIESSESFIMSGTFKQVEEAHSFLQENASQSYGIVVSNCPKRNESGSEENEGVKPPLDDKDDTEKDVSQNRPPTAAANKVVHRPERFRDETHEDSMVNSASPDTRALLKEMKARTSVKWIDSSESFIMSGTFKQVEKAHTFLQENASLTSQSYLEHEGVEVKREQEQFMVEDSHDYSSGVKTTSNLLETFLLGK